MLSHSEFYYLTRNQYPNETEIVMPLDPRIGSVLPDFTKFARP
jgi:hypothetical protein